jgi:hypothetical protein
MYSKKLFTVVSGLILLCSAFVSDAQTDSLSLNSSALQVWRIKSAETVGENINILFDENLNTADWVKAVVPGTVYAAYVASGLEPDPNFADNIWTADKKKFDQPFWYVTKFEVPKSFTREITWLNLNGCNRKAEIYLNGKRIGTLDGFMMRGMFDVTKVLKKSAQNILAVRVEPPMHPMANESSPSYLSAGGWDWMPYVPGLNSGITDKVYLSNTGPLTIYDPWIQSKLPTNAKANLTISLDVKNNSGEQRQAYVEGIITPGAIRFVKRVTIPANSTKRVELDKNIFPQLTINNPRLWWPNGYGDPNLYACVLSVREGDKLSETKNVKFGIRQYSYDTLGGILHISINGTRLFVKGGNWGMSEYLLRCRGKEYDTRVRFHKEMNMNMIRNWIGSVTDDEFYEACDKYGIMIWDDFWLNSNPGKPRDISNFNFNAIEKIKRLRNHASVAVWCGDNEGWPEAPLDNWLRENVRTYDGDDRHYQSNSNSDNLSGSGPWANKDPRYYFTDPSRDKDKDGCWGFRTELGTAVFTNVESFRKFMPKDKLWPRNEMWEKHFFGSWAFNADADGYDRSIEGRYGKPTGIEDYCRKAQLLNIETNKAMYEGWADHIGEDASGIMTWMSNASNPSLIWQTYDYYYDLTGAYWGIKSACEPVHIQWNPVTNDVKVVNTTRADVSDLTAEASVYNLDGKIVSAYSVSGKVNSISNAAATCFVLPFGVERVNIARNKPAFASSTEHGQADAVTDGNDKTRWGSEFRNNEWIYVDLESVQVINGVRVNWQEAYGKTFKVQVSNDAKNWKDVFTCSNGMEGVQEFFFTEEAEARYVRIYGVERGSGWGFSLWDFDVYAAAPKNKDLTDVQFIKLQLKDKTGKLISDNFYWRGNDRKNFTALNKLSPASLKVTSHLEKSSGQCKLSADIVNPKSGAVAFAIRVYTVKEKSGEQILPAFVSDSYFTLMPGESKHVEIEFDAALLGSDTAKLMVEPYNRK